MCNRAPPSIWGLHFRRPGMFQWCILSYFDKVAFWSNGDETKGTKYCRFQAFLDRKYPTASQKTQRMAFGPNATFLKQLSFCHAAKSKFCGLPEMHIFMTFFCGTMLFILLLFSCSKQDPTVPTIQRAGACLNPNNTPNPTAHSRKRVLVQ